MASIVADMTQSAQPALLYLVPGVLVPICVKALVQVSLPVTRLTQAHPQSHRCDITN